MQTVHGGNINNLPSNFWSEACCFQARRQRGGIAPPDLFLAPHSIFLGRKSCCYWPEKPFEFVI